MKRAILLLIVFSLTAPAQAQFFKGLFGKKKNEIVVTDTVPGMKRLQEVMNLIQSQYVSDPNTDRLSEEAVRTMLRTLDPHSIYVPAREVQRTNEALQGNFEGVGITFTVVNDTIRVQEIIAGGPAEKVGCRHRDAAWHRHHHLPYRTRPHPHPLYRGGIHGGRLHRLHRPAPLCPQFGG